MRLRWIDDPPLLRRLAWRDPIRSDTLISQDHGLMARVFGSLFGAGALIGWLLLIVGQGQGRDDRTLALIALGAALLAAVCFVGYRRLPRLFFQLLTAAGTVMITSAASAASTGAEGMYVIFYVWIALMAGLFFGARSVAAHVLFAVVAYGYVLEIRDVPFTAASLIAMASVLGTAALVIMALRIRIERFAVGLASDAHTDILTGLPNRRAFDDRFQVELARSDRTGASLSIAVCDLDRFKLLNDRLGHQAGDEALKRTGVALDRAVRSVDVAARLGGEEFGLILPGAERIEAARVGERVRRAIAEEFAEEPVPLTISCGIATLAPGGEARSLVRAADLALYRAKELGRDRSVSYDEEWDPAPGNPQSRAESSTK